MDDVTCFNVDGNAFTRLGSDDPDSIMFPAPPRPANLVVFSADAVLDEEAPCF